MTHRQRVLAALRGEPVDRIPRAPRLLLWSNAHRHQGTLPPRYRNWSLRDIERDLEVGRPARDGKIFEVRYQGVDIVTRSRGNEVRTEYRTPVGTLHTLYRQSQRLQDHQIQGREVEHLL